MNNYLKIRPDIQTGDVLLCNGKSWISGLIKFFSKGVSHVAITVVGDNGQVQVLESTKQFGKNGVQLTPMGLWLKRYRGKIYIRHLRTERTELMQKVLNEWIKKYRGTSYEKNLLQLLFAAYDGWLGKNKADMSSIFCSELVADIYICWLLIEPYPPANEYTPLDFKFGSWIDHKLRFALRPACLGKEIRIK